MATSRVSDSGSSCVCLLPLKRAFRIADFDFYTGESMNPDGMVALCNYREDGTTPYFIFWKDAMKATKI